MAPVPANRSSTRVPSTSASPLSELNNASRLGTPGLLDAIRAGGVAVLNMPGSGVLESKALMGFMPRLCRLILGEELKMPNVATWWCGQPRERETVLEGLDQMAIAGAFGDCVPGFQPAAALLGQELDGRDRARLAALMRLRGADYVGQEVVRLSTTQPVVPVPSPSRMPGWTKSSARAAAARF